MWSEATTKLISLVFVSDEIAKKIVRIEESAIIVLSSNEELTPEQLLKDFTEDSSLDDIGYWLEDKNEKERIALEGLIFCYYSKETRKRLHGNDKP